MFFRIVLFQQDLALHGQLCPLFRSKQINLLSRLIDTQCSLALMKILLYRHTFICDLCDLTVCQGDKYSKLSILSVMNSGTLLCSLHDRLRRPHDSYHHIHDHCHQEKQCQIAQQVFPDIPKYAFAQYPLHPTNPPVLPPEPASHSGNSC